MNVDRRRLRPRVRSAAGVLALVALLVAASPAARADEYEADRAGHPVRILAYLLHPVGVVLDYLLLRPTHWLGHHEPFQTLFGHEDH